MKLYNWFLSLMFALFFNNLVSKGIFREEEEEEEEEEAPLRTFQVPGQNMGRWGSYTLSPGGYIYPKDKEEEAAILADPLFTTKKAIVEIKSETKSSTTEPVKTHGEAKPIVVEETTENDEVIPKGLRDKLKSLSPDAQSALLNNIEKVLETEIGPTGNEGGDNSGGNAGGVELPKATKKGTIDTGSGNRTVDIYTAAQLKKMSEEQLQQVYADLELASEDGWTVAELIEGLTNFYANVKVSK